MKTKAKHLGILIAFVGFALVLSHSGTELGHIGSTSENAALKIQLPQARKHVQLNAKIDELTQKTFEHDAFMKSEIQKAERSLTALETTHAESLSQLRHDFEVRHD